MKKSFRDSDLEDYREPAKKKHSLTLLVCIVIFCLGLFIWIKLDSVSVPKSIKSPVETDSSPMFVITQDTLSLDNAILEKEKNPQQKTVNQTPGVFVLKTNL